MSEADEREQEVIVRKQQAYRESLEETLRQQAEMGDWEQRQKQYTQEDVNRLREEAERDQKEGK